MKTLKSQMLVIVSLICSSISQFGTAQDVDTAYFLNSNQPFMVNIQGQAYTSNAHISRIEKSTNGSDSVIIDVYWKHCLPGFNGNVPFDTTITLDLNTPATFDVRINAYKDTNTNPGCVLVDSIEHLFQYEMPNNIANLDQLEPEEKQRMKIVNLMGKETEDTSNTLLIYIYSDGTTKKVFRVH